MVLHSMHITKKMYTIQQLSIVAVLLLQITNSLVQAQSIAPLTSLSGLELNTTTPTQDYINENQRQYAAVIASYEIQIAEFKTSYELQIQTINTQSLLIEAKLEELNAQLNPLEVLSELTKHCVQKYRTEIVSIATIKTSLTSCVNTVNVAWTNIISTPDNTKRVLTNYYNNNLKSALNDCQRKFINASMNYTLCVSQAINTANSYTINNRKTFSTQLQAAKCTGNTRIDAAVDCGFTAFYMAITGIGAATRSIDSCVAQLTECAKCQNDSQCDQLYVFGSRFAQNVTLPNPFYTSNSTAPCADVHYKFAQPA